MTIAADDLREHTETDLSDDALTRLITDAYAFVNSRAGAGGAQTAVLEGGDRYLLLPRPVADDSDITSVKERVYGTETTLTTSDWRWNGGRVLERLIDGYPSYFARSVVVAYTPADDADQRDRVVIDLCKLTLAYSGLQGETAGDYQSRAVEYGKERERIVAQLLPAVGVA